MLHKLLIPSSLFSAQQSSREEHMSSLFLSSAAKRWICTIGFGLAVAVSGTSAFAQNEPFESFHDFMAHTQQARPQEFLGQTDVKLDTLMRSNSPASNKVVRKVRDEAAFEEMRQAVLARYKDVDVTHSFVLDNQHYDCVPIEQQPAVRKYHLTEIAKPPALSVSGPEGSTITDVSPVTERQSDQFGNETRCEANTVALHRLTLETLSRFPTLGDFYKKPSHKLKQGGSQDAAVPSVPGATLQQAIAQPLAATQVHKYAVFAQDVTNLGANVTLNIWSPFVNTSEDQIFSLMQIWVLGGNDTEEAGWVVFPDMFGDELSHFFIFSTADDYQTTGSWNNSAGDFVQVADSGVLGSSFGGYSSPGGAQHEFSVAYLRDASNNWWLFRGGVAVGYYPSAFYRSAPTTRNTVEVGTETVSTNNWPEAGSGNWAAALYSQAAYARNLFYYSTAGTAVWSTYHWFTNSSCYNTAGPFQNGQGGNIPQNSPNPSWWTRYVFTGGPGGANCN